MKYQIRNNDDTGNMEYMNPKTNKWEYISEILNVDKYFITSDMNKTCRGIIVSFKDMDNKVHQCYVSCKSLNKVNSFLLVLLCNGFTFNFQHKKIIKEFLLNSIYEYLESDFALEKRVSIDSGTK